MFTEAVLLVAGLAGTLGVGIPIANALASPHRWRSLWTADRAARTERPRVDTTPAYKPLDLGPDPTRWPSERAWPTTTTLRAPQWPSRSWDDAHFGSHWRKSTADHVEDRGFHAMAARPPAASDAPTPPRAPARATPQQAQQRTAARRAEADDESWFQDTADETRRRANELRRRQQQAPTAEDARRRQQQVALDPARRGAATTARPQQPRVAEPAPRKAPQQVTIQDPRSRSRSASPPERADLERLIETVGLAGTVQAIMDRTGWEFREAAHYLAKIRNGRE